MIRCLFGFHKFNKVETELYRRMVPTEVRPNGAFTGYVELFDLVKERCDCGCERYLKVYDNRREQILKRDALIIKENAQCQ